MKNTQTEIIFLEYIGENVMSVKLNIDFPCDYMKIKKVSVHDDYTTFTTDTDILWNLRTNINNKFIYAWSSDPNVHGINEALDLYFPLDKKNMNGTFIFELLDGDKQISNNNANISIFINLIVEFGQY